jgi:tetratricopeptide (TPR) repeat protein
LLPRLWYIPARIVIKALNRNNESLAAKVAVLYTRLRPRDPHSWILYQGVHYRAGRLVEAEEVLRKGLTYNPDSVELQAELAAILKEQDKIAEAEELLEMLRKQHPDSPMPLVELASIAVRKKEWGEAKRLAESVLTKLDTSEHEGYQMLKRMAGLFLDIPGEEEAARRLFLRAIELTPRDPGPHLYMGLLLERENSMDLSNKHLVLARRYWDGSEADFFEFMRTIRNALAKYPDSEGEYGSGNGRGLPKG